VSGNLPEPPAAKVETKKGRSESKAVSKGTPSPKKVSNKERNHSLEQTHKGTNHRKGKKTKKKKPHPSFLLDQKKFAGVKHKRCPA